MVNPAQTGRIHPVILSGGSGTRLWPLSRALHPKQLLPLLSDRSLLQETALRVSARERFAPPLVVTNDEYRFIVAEQLRLSGIAPHSIILEPAQRNTAPAAWIAALALLGNDPEALILLLPSDHAIGDAPVFLDAVDRAAMAARAGRFLTFGITPNQPETG